MKEGDAEALARQLASNPAHAGFLSHEFDSAGYASTVVAKDGAEGGGGSRSHAEVCSADLRGRVGEIESTIHAHAREHHEELLSRVGSVKELSRTTEAVSADAADLRASMGRIGRELLAPHARMSAKTLELGRIQACSALLRDVLQFNYAAKRLRKQLHAAAAVEQAGAEDAARHGGGGGGDGGSGADTQDLALAAQSLHELEALLASGGGTLRQVTAVDELVPWVEQEGSRVRSRAAAAARAALLAQAQSELGDALQVSFNLRELPALAAELAAAAAASAGDASRASWGEVVGIAERALEEASASDMMGDDMMMGGAMVGGGGDTAQAGLDAIAGDPKWHAAVWSRVERVLERSLETAMQLWNLRRVLAKKRDAVSRQDFLRCVMLGHEGVGGGGGVGGVGDTALFDAWWVATAKAMRRSLETQLCASEPLAASLAARYPKLRRAARRTALRIFRGTALAAAEISEAAEAAATNGGEGDAAAEFDVGADDVYRQEVAVAAELRRARGGGGGGGMEDAIAAAALTPAGALAVAQTRSRTTLRVLLGAFAPLREAFLAEAGAALMLPVSQMFPDAAGYVPSPPGRHDIDTFVRTFGAALRDARDAMGAPESISAGIGAGEAAAAATAAAAVVAAGGAGGQAGGATDGDAAFLLSLARAALVPAVGQLSTKLGSLHSTGRDAFFFSATSWARSEVQQHNLALVTAAFRLRDGLTALPSQLAPEQQQQQQQQQQEEGGAGAADAGTYAAAAALQLRRGLERCVRPSMRQLRSLGEVVFSPYLAAAGRQLGKVLSRMHNEHFGADTIEAPAGAGEAAAAAAAAAADSAASPPVGAEGTSAYITDLRAAVSRLAREHLEKLPAGGASAGDGAEVEGETEGEGERSQQQGEAGGDLASACIKKLAAMVVRAFSRHLTLVRPLGEGGKLRIAADMAHFELALEPLLHAATKGTGKLELSDLGAAYAELRSLRQLLFVEVRERSQPPRARATAALVSAR